MLRTENEKLDPTTLKVKLWCGAELDECARTGMFKRAGLLIGISTALKERMEYTYSMSW